MRWPWQRSGTEAVVAPAEGAPAGETVYRFRVRGTADLDLSYEVIQPDDKFEPLPTALRRLIGLVRLSGDERNDRDLRLVQGSALDRMLNDKGFRARAGRALASENVGEHLEAEAKKALGSLDTAFKDKALPSPLGLGGIQLPERRSASADPARRRESLPLPQLWQAPRQAVAGCRLFSSVQRGALRSGQFLHGWRRSRFRGDAIAA